MVKKALILIDLQNDFCKLGSMEVPEGDAVIPLANQIQPYFELIIATQDWHPKDHLSFADNHDGKKTGDIVKLGEIDQILWPIHCVKKSKGSEFHPQLNLERISKVFRKGMNRHVDSYSAFFDNAHKRSTGLVDYLHDLFVEDIYMMGLATDYCVKYSVLDAIDLGFNVYVVIDGCRGVELNPGDIDQAIKEMKKSGAKIISATEIIHPPEKID